MKNIRIKLLLIFLLSLLFSGCRGVAFSPEAAVTRELLRRSGSTLVVDAETIKIHQTIEINDAQAIVMLSFEGTRPATGLEVCTAAYESIKQTIGWVSANGSRGCRTVANGLAVEEFEVHSGRYSGRLPQDPGYSIVYGFVHDPAVEKISVTWDDNVVTEADVVESSFIAIRSGQYVLQLIEGLDH
jgi:hypothetical protein